MQSSLENDILEGVTLENVLYVPQLKKNLIITILLTKNEFKCVFVSNKVVINKNKIYV